jgi:hypothetical protein
MRYSMPKSEGADMSWKHAAMTLAAVFAIFAVVYFIVKARDPSYDAERAAVLRVAYSHPDITSRVGSVSTASFVMKKKEGLALLSRFQAADWVRTRHEGVTKGSARVFVLGAKEGGFFVIHYTFVEKSGGFTLESVDASAFDSPQERRSSQHSQRPGADAPRRG